MSSKTEKKNDAPERKGPSMARGWLENITHFDPVQFVADIWDAFDLWRSTRRWRPILIMIPGILFFLTAFGTITFGMMTRNQTKLAKYAKKADIVSPIKSDGLNPNDRKTAKKLTSVTNKLDQNGLTGEDDKGEASDEEKKELAEQEAKNAEFADLLFRRVLQLEPTNKNARYFVAYQQGIRGNTEQARATMQTLAPADTTSFLPAHAWMAMDLLQQLYVGTKVDMNELTHHLSVASEWQGTNAFVLSAYAQKLESEGKVNTAINMLQKAAQRDSGYNLPLSAMMAKHSQPVQAKEAADRAINYYSESFGKKDEKDRDRIAVAEVHVQAKKYEEAIKVLQEGLRIRDDRPAVRRALSNVYRLMYSNSRTQTDSGFKVNLGLLNRALSADPTNPGVGEDIAWLQTVGVTADEKMVQSLREQLATGGANAITHLLLGNAFMNKGNIEKAMSHWQLAMGQDPNLVIAMNNLAVGLSMLDPPKIDEALKMIDRAIELSRGEAEFLDSKGEILQRAGRFSEAIVQYEKAIQRAPMRVETREKLVKCYENADMRDLADAQMSLIAKIREQFKASGLSENGRPTARTAPTKSPKEKEKAKVDTPKQVLPDALFEGIPSQTDKPDVSAPEASKSEGSK